MDFKKAIDIIVEQVISVVRTLIEDAPFDRTYTGTVVFNDTSTNSSLHTLGVLIDGKTRIIKSSLDLDAGTTIKVLVPRSNWNNATILINDLLYMVLTKQSQAQEEQEGGDNVNG